MNTEVNTRYQFRVLKAKSKEKYYPQIKYPGSIEWSFDIHPEYNDVIVRDNYDDAVKNWTMDLRYRSLIRSQEDVPLVREDPNEKILVGKWDQIHENAFRNFQETKEHLLHRLNRVYRIVDPYNDPEFKKTDEIPFPKYVPYSWEVCNWDGNRCIHLYLFNYKYKTPEFKDFYFPFELLNYAVEKDIKEEFEKFLKKYPATMNEMTLDLSKKEA